MAILDAPTTFSLSILTYYNKSFSGTTTEHPMRVSANKYGPTILLALVLMVRAPKPTCYAVLGSNSATWLVLGRITEQIGVFVHAP